jgi:hypothetical protein
MLNSGANLSLQRVDWIRSIRHLDSPLRVTMEETCMNRFSAGLRFLAFLISHVTGLTFAVQGAEPLMQRKSSKPPNIVFIFSDDHAYQAISAYNDPRRLI